MRLALIIEILVMTALIYSGVYSSDVTTASTNDVVIADSKADVRVSYDGKAQPKDIFKSLSESSMETIIIETSVKGEYQVSLNNVPLEVALSTVCKAAKIEWRKLYIQKDSKLIEQPDKLAKQSQILFSMSDDDRRAMLKFNLSAMTSITAEQQKILQEDMKIITEQILSEQK